ncbi:MAG: tellurite resistance/C4-dicarboxylate transporter family protein [Microbacterium sp.]
MRTRLIAVIDALPPNAFAAVMATGIFGVAVTHIVSPAIGMVLFVIAETFLLALMVGTIARAIRDRHGFAAAAREIGPALGWFTFPTAIAVSAALANALAIPGVRWPALIIAVLSWLFLSYVVLPTAFSRHKSSPLADTVDGTWLLLVVSTQALSIVCSLAGAAVPAIVLWGTGIVLYLLLASALLARLLHNSGRYAAPTVWIVMGATAVSALAATRIADLDALRPLVPFLDGMAVMLWGFGSLCIPYLILLGVRRYFIRREPVRFEVGLWSVVFPLGMYATATHALASVLHAEILDVVAVIALVATTTAWIGVVVLAAIAFLRIAPADAAVTRPEE